MLPNSALKNVTSGSRWLTWRSWDKTRSNLRDENFFTDRNLRTRAVGKWFIIIKRFSHFPWKIASIRRIPRIPVTKQRPLFSFFSFFFSFSSKPERNCADLVTFYFIFLLIRNNEIFGIDQSSLETDRKRRQRDKEEMPQGSRCKGGRRGGKGPNGEEMPGKHRKNKANGNRVANLTDVNYRLTDVSLEFFILCQRNKVGE